MQFGDKDLLRLHFPRNEWIIGFHECDCEFCKVCTDTRYMCKHCNKTYSSDLIAFNNKGMLPEFGETKCPGCKHKYDEEGTREMKLRAYGVI